MQQWAPNQERPKILLVIRWLALFSQSWLSKIVIWIFYYNPWIVIIWMLCYNPNSDLLTKVNLVYGRKAEWTHSFCLEPTLGNNQNQHYGALHVTTFTILQIGSHPNIYVLDTPGVLSGEIVDDDLGSKLALSGTDLSTYLFFLLKFVI